MEAARVLESLQGALATDAALLSEAESQAIAAATQALQQAAQGEDPAAIEDAIKTLDAQTQDLPRAAWTLPFAARWLAILWMRFNHA